MWWDGEDQSETTNMLQELTVLVPLWLAVPVHKSFILKGDTITSPWVLEVEKSSSETTLT